jgi:two-component system OmpR family sensor kinase
MQLARAEGGRLMQDQAADLRPVLRLVIDDMARQAGADRLRLMLPDVPVLSHLDPDAFAIVVPNLVENALRHGAAGGTVEIALTDGRVLEVQNDGPCVAPDVLGRLTGRFVRAGSAEGSGLGLAIVAAIAERSGAHLQLASPRPGRPDGFAVRLALPPLRG